MKFKLGEFVRFVNERREGYITKIIDEHTLAVTDEDGFEIPVLMSEVTHVHGKTELLEEGKTNSSDDKLDAEFISAGIFLAVVPDKHSPSVVHFHLVNQSSWTLLCSLYSEKKKLFKGEYAGILNPISFTKIYSASLNELDLWPKFHIKLLRYSSGNEEMLQPIIFSEKFKAKDFSGSKKHNALINQTAWIIQLDDNELIIDVEKLKESFFKPRDEKLEIEKPAKEVDLHIEKLRDDYQFLTSSQIFDIQMEQFHRSLDAAIVHKLTSITFIHGTGNGTLRNEMHKVISKHPQIRTFMDAYKEKFGYGATEVFLK